MSEITLSISIATVIERLPQVSRMLRKNLHELAGFKEVILVIQGDLEQSGELIGEALGHYLERIPQARVLTMPEYGISRSRNRAIQSCRSGYLWIVDDDVELLPGAYARLRAAMRHNQAAVYCAEIVNCEDGQPYKDYNGMRDRYCTAKSDLLKRSSIEIVLSVDYCRRTACYFNVNLGVGTPYPSGEENLFLLQVLRTGAAIRFIAQAVVSHPRRIHDLEKLGARQNLMAKGVLLREYGFWFGLATISGWVRRYAFQGMRFRHIFYLIAGFVRSRALLDKGWPVGP